MARALPSKFGLSDVGTWSALVSGRILHPTFTLRKFSTLLVHIGTFPSGSPFVVHVPEGFRARRVYVAVQEAMCRLGYVDKGEKKEKIDEVSGFGKGSFLS